MYCKQSIHIDWLQVAEEFRAKIQGDVESVSKAVLELESEERAIDKQHDEYLAGVQSTETAINQHTAELKLLIDRQADRLLRQVKVQRQRRDEEVTRRKNDVILNRLVLLDFQKYSQQVIDKGTMGVGTIVIY